MPIVVRGERRWVDEQSMLESYCDLTKRRVHLLRNTNQCLVRKSNKYRTPELHRAHACLECSKHSPAIGHPRA